MARWITWLLSRARFEREMRDELRAHIELRADDLVRVGLPRDEALRRARIEFGAVEAYKEQCRDASGFLPVRPFHGAWGDLRLATRRLLATPFFLIFAVVSLALGLGVTTAVYSLLDTLFWRPLPFHQPERLAFITAPAPGNPTLFPQALSYQDFDDLRAAAPGAGEFAASARLTQNLVTPDVSDVVIGEAVTGNFFEVLAVHAALGRTIQPADVARGAAVVVLAHTLWTTAFDADPDVVGRVVRLGGQPFEIIGVAPPSFGGLTLDPVMTSALWVPLPTIARLGRMAETMKNRDRGMLSVVARMAPGRSLDAVSAEVRAVGRTLDHSVPIHQTYIHQDGAGRETRAVPRDWTARHPSDLRPNTPARLAWLVAAVVGLVLVVACTNLANLMLARGAARQHEFAVRRALGASRWRLVRELSAESAVIAVIGGAVALAVTQTMLVLFTVDIPTTRGVVLIEPDVSLWALGLASVALALSLIVFGLEPALQLTRKTVSPGLASAAGNLSGPSQGRQRSLLRWQVAICTCFFLIAAILGKVIVAEITHDPGIDLQRLALARVSFQTLGWDEARARRALAAALDEAGTEAAIESVAVISGMPFGDTSTPLGSVSTPDVPGVKSSLVLHSSPEIFRTLGVSILRGRAFDHRDDAAAPAVTVISERTARDLFGTADAIGREISLQAWFRPPTIRVTVVGIAADTDTGRVFSRTTNVVYIPHAQQYHEHGLVLVARTAGDPAAAARVLQGVLRRVDPEFGTTSAGAASILLAGELVIARIAGVLAVSLGALTLLLSMVGLFGVQSEIVSRRTREVGVRVALGATAQQIRRMVLGQGFRPVLQGMALGLFFGVACRFGLRAILGAPIEILDPVAFTVIPAVLFAAAYLACLIPARRAAGVDPNVALRHL